MATTSRAGITYPDQSDSADMAASMLEMMTSAEGFVVSKHTSTTTRGTAIPSPVNGDVCFVTDTALGASNNAINLRKAGAWTSIYSSPLFATKGGTETVSASTATQADNDLTVTTEANRYYTVDVWLVMTGIDAGDFKYNFTQPTSSGVALGHVGHSTTSTAAAPILNATAYAYDNSASPTGDLTAGTITSVTTNLHIRGLLYSGSGGAFALNWAQNNASGSTVLEVGCYMALTRVL